MKRKKKEKIFSLVIVSERDRKMRIKKEREKCAGGMKIAC